MGSYNFMPMVYNQHHSAIDEHHWLSLVRSALDKEASQEEEVKVQVSVFFVPKNLLCVKPEAYMPQLFALGPYHHWVPHLYDMERYKLAAAKKIQRDLHALTLNELVSSLMKHEQRIRSHYHKHLDFTGETLAWMMAIDATFLLEFLHNFSPEAEAAWKAQQSTSRHMWDAARMKMAYNTVTRDVVMLENQIPFFLLRKILRRCRGRRLADEELSRMLMGFVKDVSPFRVASCIPFIDVKQYAHLLQLLYLMIVPKVKVEEFDQLQEVDCHIDVPGGEEEGTSNPGFIRKLFNSVWSWASGVNEGATIQTIKRFIIVGPVKFLVKVPWKIISSFPGISLLKQPVEALLHGGAKAKDEDAADGSSSGSKPPLVEEIMVPSVKELIWAGVRFMPSEGDLTTIRFEVLQKSVTIYLPIVSLDANAEVVMRNLVAYETSAESGPMVFTRYTELMNGIIDSEEDVKLLRKSGIILNRMKSDAEVAELWNGMSKSVRLSRVQFMDKVLGDVNSYYNSRWQVRAKKFLRKYVFGSWQLLTLLAAVALLLLTCLQAFCNVYSCGERWFNITEKDS